MAVEKATRPSIRQGRAKTSTVIGDVNIVNEKLARDYERGTFWAGIAVVMTLGPLMIMHALGVF